MKNTIRLVVGRHNPPIGRLCMKRAVVPRAFPVQGRCACSSAQRGNFFNLRWKVDSRKEMGWMQVSKSAAGGYLGLISLDTGAKILARNDALLLDGCLNCFLEAEAIE